MFYDMGVQGWCGIAALKPVEQVSGTLGVVHLPAAAPSLIQSKLAVPSRGCGVVERPRLQQRLRAAIAAQPVVLVTAAAGSGKTTAVVDAVIGGPFPVAWLSVDRTDASPGRLLSYLEEALRRCRPSASGVATTALADGLPHAEAAGLLVEAAGDSDLVLVLDDLERLEESAPAWWVVEAVIRYAPSGMRVVLIGRKDPPASLLSLPPVNVAAIGDDQLAFTLGEATAALAEMGKTDIEPAAAIEATGGWVAGVLFEAWQSSGHTAVVAGEDDPLNGYLSAHILGQLRPAARAFLITTSILEEVTAAAAEALGLPAAGEVLTELRGSHLPVTWSDRGRTMRCHSRFRDYLLELLHRRGDRDLQQLRLAHARFLKAVGRNEDATDEFLHVDAIDDALCTAEEAIMQVVERLDIDIAERWLERLSDVLTPGPTVFAAAELMVAMARDDFRRGVRVADRLLSLGRREEFARRSARDAGLMAWSYFHAGRPEDVRAVLSVAAPDRVVSMLRYGLGLLVDEFVEPADRPAPVDLTGGSVDLIVYATDYCRGHLRELVGEPTSRWTQELLIPWRIAALRASGHTESALLLYKRACAPESIPLALASFIGPELLIDLGRRSEARSALARGRSAAVAAGSLGLTTMNTLIEAKAALRLDRDAEAARAILTSPEMEHAARRSGFTREVRDTWLGFAALLTGDTLRACELLRSAVESMVSRERRLELPTAAAYLAEAEWRSGEEDAADRAATLALTAAERQGSNHILLQALSDVPAVVARQRDLCEGADSPWHAIARALHTRCPQAFADAHPMIVLHEFGQRALFVGDVQQRPRVAKSYELLALLACCPGQDFSRSDLLEILFDGRVDDSARSYLRTAIQSLRQCLPDGVLVLDGGRVRLISPGSASTESTRFQANLAAAAHLRADARLTATTAALTAYDRGEYLPGRRAEWAEKRARELSDIANEARCDAAEIALELSQHAVARPLVTQALEFDPTLERAWRLEMHIADMRGDQGGITRAYHRCSEALAELKTEPSATTRQLLDSLRR